jgi:cytochrome c biogenesis factor
VAKLETALEILTRDVTSLAGMVREQSRNIEGEIQRLAVAITEANAPKKTEWTMLIHLGMLIIAIGSAIFWPLNQTALNNKEEIHELRQVVEAHVLSEGHPVTISRLNKVESNNDERNKADMEELREIRKRVMVMHLSDVK